MPSAASDTLVIRGRTRYHPVIQFQLHQKRGRHEDLGQSGAGAPAATYLLVKGAGGQDSGFVFDLGSRGPVPICRGAEGDQLFLILYGTGMRDHAEEAVATIGGMLVSVFGPAAQPTFAGLDQLNLGPVPRTLLGSGAVDIVLIVDGKKVNVVTLILQ